MLLLVAPVGAKAGTRPVSWLTRAGRRAEVSLPPDEHGPSIDDSIVPHSQAFLGLGLRGRYNAGQFDTRRPQLQTRMAHHCYGREGGDEP